MKSAISQAFATKPYGMGQVRIASLALSFALSASNACAVQKTQDDAAEPTADANGTISRKIEHRLADWSHGISPFGSLNHVVSSAVPPSGSTGANVAPISYHGGAIMPSVSKIAVIWYGNWNQNNGTDTAGGQQIIRDLLAGLATAPTANGTNYSGITTGPLGPYSQTGGSSVSAISSPILLEFTQTVSSTYGGTRLSDSSVLNLVKTYAGKTPDANAIYLVLTSSDISESSGFLTKYCGWHSYNSKSFAGTPIKYAFIGNPNKSLASCSYQTTASPNNNPAVDAMVSVIAHELMETVSDPQLNAWYNAQGQESSDMCAWTFGSVQSMSSNGSYYNVTLPSSSIGTRSFLLQRALSASDSKCYINASGPQQ